MKIGHWSIPLSVLLSPDYLRTDATGWMEHTMAVPNSWWIELSLMNVWVRVHLHMLYKYSIVPLLSGQWSDLTKCVNARASWRGLVMSTDFFIRGSSSSDAMPWGGGRIDVDQKRSSRQQKPSEILQNQFLETTVVTTNIWRGETKNSTSLSLKL